MSQLSLSAVGTLDLIVGPMFAGKSSEVIRRVRRYRVTQVPVLVVHHALDTRYAATGGFVVSHDGVREPAHALQVLADVHGLPGYASAQVIMVEEAQFYAPDDLVDTVRNMVDQDHKSVVVSALDGDWQRQPFGGVLRLLPLADHVTRLQALCAVCHDGTPAPFTQRWGAASSPGAQVVAVGGADMYRPVCRRHYLHV